jgi:hypothetical protein
MRDWAAELVDRGQVREQQRVRAQDEAAPEEERPIVDRHERLANGNERASVGASSSRHVFRNVTTDTTLTMPTTMTAASSRRPRT